MEFSSLLTVAQKNAKTSSHSSEVCNKLDETFEEKKVKKYLIYAEVSITKTQIFNFLVSFPAK